MVQPHHVGPFARTAPPRLNNACPNSPAATIQAAEECWHVYYGDVHAGTIAIRTGIPHDEDPWEWNCGFYPGSHPGECTSGTAATFDQARADFEAAWRVFLSNRTEADFEEWRHQRDWTARKYAMWERGELLPSQKPNSWMGCPCGERFDSHDLAGSYVHREHIYAAQATDGIRRRRTEPKGCSARALAT